MATRPRRAARGATRPALRVVSGRQRPARSALVPAAAVVVCAVFAVAALQAYLAREGFEAARVERRLREAEERLVLLRAQVAELSAPRRMEEAARRLGLTEPSDPIYLPAPPGVSDARSRRVGAAFELKRLLEDP